MFFFRWKVTWPVFTFRSYESCGGQCHERKRAGRTVAHLDINLVTTQYNWDVLANTLEVTVPVGDVLVRDTGGDVEHDDATLALDVIPIPEATELLLPSSIPYVEADGAEVC